MLEKLVSKVGIINKLQTAISNKVAVSVFGANFGEKLAIISDCQNCLIVEPDKDSAIKTFNALVESGKNCRVVTSKVVPTISEVNNCAEMALCGALCDILGGDADYLIVSAEVLLNKLPNPTTLQNKMLKLKVGNSYNLIELNAQLTQLGLRRVDADCEQMEYSFKGDVLTLFLPDYSTPIRISFFDDEIEYIKLLTPDLLGVQENLTQLTISPSTFVGEFNFGEIKYNNISAEQVEVIKNNIEQALSNAHGNKIDSWLHPFCELNNTIFDYFNDGHVFFNSPKQIINVLKSELETYKQQLKDGISLGNFVNEHKNFYFTDKQLFTFGNCGLVAFQNINNANNIFKPSAVFSLVTTPLLNYTFSSATLANDMARFSLNGYTVVLFAGNKVFAGELQQKLQSKLSNIFICNTISQISLGSVNIVCKALAYSYCFNDEKLVVIGLNKKQAKHQNNNFSADAFGFLPQVGDYVVHASFGIGRCISLTKLTLNNATRDYVELEYKGGDKLFLPVENIDSLSKYIGSDKSPKLNKLGSSEFIKTKQKVKNNLKQLTFDLKKLYAERSEIKGIKFVEDDELMQNFEDQFPYALTADQEKAVFDIKSDMQSRKTMDRLVCGDVGYGKTEVAMRAAFKAVLSGYQVMLLCPTTILSEQHYNTCIERMQNFGVKIEVLNRFKSKAETNQILQKLQDGEIDILCGTHRLLSSDVQFKKLGLLILDEEQRFGVEHKEKIKKIKTNIDVLTLSATPIPRTMHISLIGVKDISIIATPPMERIPVMAQVMEFNESQVKMYIDRELNRGGQVLIVYNRVETIYDFASQIKKMVGDNVVVDVAHGQMNEKVLENSIFNLYSGKTQVLVSTVLIENGIDLPNANTLIVVNADMLGLSQLYQLKGRIGRSNQQAYALFTIDKGKVLSTDAYKRLEAIVEFSGLGNGFKIAMRDLEIRGAGSIFGAEQSGHIESVGYSMYLTLLNDALKELNGANVKSYTDVKIDCYFEANLPNYYISGTQARIGAYNEVAKIENNDQFNQLFSKFEDNFGTVPNELKNLMQIAQIKNIAKTINIKKISILMFETVIRFEQINDQLLKVITQICSNINFGANLNVSNGVVLTIKNKNDAQKTCENLINILNLFNNN